MNRFAPASQDLHSWENCFLHHYWHLNRLPRLPSQLTRYCRVFSTHKQGCSWFTGRQQGWKLLPPSFLSLKQACTCFTAPLRRLKWRCKVFPAHKHVCTSFTGLPQLRNLLFPSFLALKQAYTCFTAPPPRLKRLCRVFPAHDHVWTSIKEPPQRTKQLSPYILALKQACTCFTAPFGCENSVVVRFQHINRF